jgi:hypothetical protein
MRSLLARRVRCCMCHRIASPARATRIAPSAGGAEGMTAPVGVRTSALHPAHFVNPVCRA